MVMADVLLLPLALWSAIALLLGQWSLELGPHWWPYALTVAISLPIFLSQGLYRAVVRYLETRAFVAVIAASLAAALVFSHAEVSIDV